MLSRYLSLVKFAHTLFAMPFALTGFFLAAWPESKFEWRLLLLVVVCMVFARNAAMGFNRYIDRQFDEKNERTRIREIPAGQISPTSALIFVILNSLLFIAATWFINPICFYLSPVALAVVLGYSYTKRFTALCHLVLGLGLGLAPVGAWLAVKGSFALEPILLGLAVLTWVSGFDIIYALQDDEFDKHYGLHSIPAMLGREKALNVSNLLHILSAGFIGTFSWMSGGGFLLWTGTILFWALLVSQHRLVKPKDLSKVNLAFFTTNGIASLVFACFAIADLMLGKS